MNYHANTRRRGQYGEKTVALNGRRKKKSSRIPPARGRTKYTVKGSI